MIICICSNINEEEIEKMIKDGHDTLDKLIEHGDVAIGCGTCQNAIIELLDKHTIDTTNK